eukprot:9021754-Alexandrium_andersonii.AAC.1
MVKIFYSCARSSLVDRRQSGGPQAQRSVPGLCGQAWHDDCAEGTPVAPRRDARLVGGSD